MVFGLEGKKVKQDAVIGIGATKEQLIGSLMRAKGEISRLITLCIDNGIDPNSSGP